MSDSKKFTFHDKVFEPIAIIGSKNKDNNEELIRLFKEVGITLVIDEENKGRGLGLATIQRGSAESKERAIRLTPVLNRKDRRQLLKELQDRRSNA